MNEGKMGERDERKNIVIFLLKKIREYGAIAERLT